MKKLDWYIFRKYIGTFFYSISLLIVIVIVFDVSENIGDFMKASFREVVFDYYLPFIPYFINLFIYLFSFISVIFFTSKLAGHSEIIAMLGSGVSYWRFLVPYIYAALVLAVMSLYLGNILIPQQNVIRRGFKTQYMENLTKSSGRDIHVQTERNKFAYVESYNIKNGTGVKFSLEEYDGSELVYKLTAGRIIFDTVHGQVKLNNYTERFIDGYDERLVRGKVKDTVLNVSPRDFYYLKEDYEEMNFWELRDCIDREKIKGSANLIAYEVEMHRRMASPVAIIILTIIGASLSSTKQRGGIGIHLGVGIAITFLYILLMQFAKAFCSSGTLSPALAAWMPNILYSFIALYFLWKAPK